MRQKIKPILLSLLLFGIAPLILQITPVAMMLSGFFTPLLIAGYYIITRKLLKSGNFNIITAVISSLTSVILSYNVGVLYYLVGSIFWSNRSISDITNILGLFSLSTFPVSALIGSISAKLYCDIKTKSKIINTENIVVVFLIIIGIITLIWNFKYLEASPERRRIKRETDLQKINSAPYLELNDFIFTPRQPSISQDWEEFQNTSPPISMNIPSFLKANTLSDRVISINYNNSIYGNLFATVTMYLKWGLDNNFPTKDNAIISLLDYLKPKVYTLDWPIKINPNGESSKSLNNQELYFLTTEYSNPTQAKNNSKTLYVVIGTPVDGYEIWKTYLSNISKGEPDNVEIVKQIIESIN